MTLIASLQVLCEVFLYIWLPGRSGGQRPTFPGACESEKFNPWPERYQSGQALQ